MSNESSAYLKRQREDQFIRKVLRWTIHERSPAGTWWLAPGNVFMEHARAYDWALAVAIRQDKDMVNQMRQEDR